MINFIRNYAILILLFSFCIGLNACVRCSKAKYAIYFPEKKIIQLHDDGKILSPLTPEGSFPEDNHVLTIYLKSPLNEIVGEKLKVGKDITILHNYAESGYIEVFKKTINVNLKYSRKYWEDHNGSIPLRIAVNAGSDL